MLKIPGKIKNSVGLDLGSFAIKAVSVKGPSGGEVLTAYGVRERLPENERSLAEQIEQLFKDMNVSPALVNMSVSGQDVIVRFVDLPRMSDKELEEVLSFEAEKYIPFNIADVNLDHMILGDSEQTGQMRVLLAAVRKQPVNRILEVAESLGVRVGVVDSDLFAVFNAFSMFNQVPLEGGCAFLDIGHDHSDILLCMKGQPGLLRQVSVGAGNISKTLSRQLSISEDEAGRIMSGPADGIDQQARYIFRSVVESIAREVQLSFDYFENKYGTSITRTFVSGGLSNQDLALDLFKEKIGSELDRWDPVEQIDLADNISRDEICAVSAQLPVSLGLALRG